MDYILREIVKNTQDIGFNDDLLRAADYIVELEQRLAEAEAKIPRWIPVSEGLPPPIGRSPSVYGSEWVIASYRWNGAVFIGECRFVHGPKQAWKTSNDDYDIEVTHWMPLPEAPKSGKGE